jgi:polar amino acid transport system substrate-binding protein
MPFKFAPALIFRRRSDRSMSAIDETGSMITTRVEVLAGLRTWLLQEAEKLPGSRLLDGKFTAVQQAIGTRRTNKEGVEFLTAFVKEAKQSGLVADLIAQYRIQGLSVATVKA